MISVLFLLLVLIKLVEDSEDLHEQFEKVEEELEGVCRNVAVASLCLLHDNLCVENDPQASHEQGAHDVTKSESRPHHPAHELVHHHNTHHCRDDSAKEQE